jgi:hypothetical protein
MSQNALSFNDEIDQRVLERIAAGITKFNYLLENLPGIYPLNVLESLRRLSDKKIISFSIINDAISYTKTLPNHILNSRKSSNFLIPHPLDYDWRFTEHSIETLTKLCKKYTRIQDSICLLGIPSLFYRCPKSLSERNIVLFDKNYHLAYNTKRKNKNSYVCDILKDNLPDIHGQLIILDPPWYLDYSKSFLWASTQLCNLNGHIMISLPPKGTRPQIHKEIKSLMKWSKRIGLALKDYIPSALDYESPLFERNALRVKGINNFPKSWRRGDLAIFTLVAKPIVERPMVNIKEEWNEISIRGVRIKIRKRPSTVFRDPSLIPIVPMNILESVSRRNPKRSIVDVWTSGNRVFACKGCNILVLILEALSKAQSPILNISSHLNRKLSIHEQTLVLDCAKRMTDIVVKEYNERIENGYLG